MSLFIKTMTSVLRARRNHNLVVVGFIVVVFDTTICKQIKII